MPSRLKRAFKDLIFAFDAPGDPWRRAAGHVLQASFVMLGLVAFTSVFTDEIAPLFANDLVGRLTAAVPLASLYAAIYAAAIRQQRRAPAAWASVALVTVELCLIATLFPYLYLLARAFLPAASLAALRGIDDQDGLSLLVFIGFLLFGVKGWMRYAHRAAHLRDASASAVFFERMAMEDSLTGLPNRRRFEAVANGRLHPDNADVRASLSLLMIDVDRFKAINDTWSHDMGDLVLKSIAGRLAAVVGNAGLAARLAGDEFVVALFDADAGAARDMAGRLRRAVDEVDWNALQPGLRASISVGVAPALPGDTLADLMRRSDVSMYEDKRSG